ncbi:hypothetical protein [Herbiconiux liukaitaii]|uniref:hypothetical protein n=1 Tax=Herbiconiux liukaitaii TaxID=3342799 RepID=UPI0035BACCAC
MSTEDALSLTVDEDGFVCLVAPDTYRGFVHEDWELEQLLAHFTAQMNEGSLFIAYPGPDHADDPLEFTGGAVDAPVLREAVSIVRVGPAGLWVTDYTQLTMAAQFDDEAPTGPGAIRLPVPEGAHRVTLQHTAGVPRFTLTITPAPPAAPGPLTAVPWFE